MPYRLDPELAAALAAMRPRPVDLAGRREVMRLAAGAAPAPRIPQTMAITDVTVDGPPGAPPLALRLYRQLQPAAPTAGLLYIHGGGFTSGSVLGSNLACAKYAAVLGITVVSVEYRLAPEHPYPAGLDDCFAALSWFANKATSLGVDPARIGTMGGSAGGGLAAGLALLARDRVGPAICYQHLVYPEIDDRLDTPSMRSFTDTPIWNLPLAQESWRMYLGAAHAPGGPDVPSYAAPARAADLSGLPPAFVIAAEFDPLRDEDLTYALRLAQAGVAVELHMYPGTFHGFGVFASGAAVSKRAARDDIEGLRRGLGLDASRD